jgi:tetratricopeptide (TPR) repeat protein
VAGPHEAYYNLINLTAGESAMAWTWRKTRLLLMGLALLGPALLAVHLLWLPDVPRLSWQASYDRGTSLSSHGELRLAQWHLQRALCQVESLGPESPELADTLLALAGVEIKQSRLAEAEPRLRQALAIQEKVYGGDGLALEDVLMDLSDIYVRREQWREAAGVVERLVAVWSRNRGWQLPCTRIMADCLGMVYQHLGEYERCRAVYESIRDNVSDPGWKHYASIKLIECCKGQKDWGAAEAAARNALQFLGENPGCEEKRGQVLLLLSGVYADQKKYPQAQEAARTALNLFRSFAASQEGAVAALVALAYAQRSAGALAQAVATAKEAMDILERRPGASLGQRTAASAMLGGLYLEQGNYSKAVEILKPALAASEQSGEHEEGLTAGLFLILGAAYFGQEDYSQAAPLWSRAIEMTEKASSETPPRKQALVKAALSVRLDEYAVILRKAGRQGEADQKAARAKALREEVLDQDAQGRLFEGIEPLLPR